MIQLSLFEDQKPTPAEREAQQLVGIQEWLHVWNDDNWIISFPYG